MTLIAPRPRPPRVPNLNWVCWTCRKALRRVAGIDPSSVKCPTCGEAAWCLGCEIPVPPKRDGRSWKRLRMSAVRNRARAWDWLTHDAVRRRHALERRLTGLVARAYGPTDELAIVHLKGEIVGFDAARKR